jgi:hypothetical protein
MAPCRTLGEPETHVWVPWTCPELLSTSCQCCVVYVGELRHCGRLRELHLEHNRLASPLLDLTHATDLVSLQVLGQHWPHCP